MPMALKGQGLRDEEKGLVPERWPSGTPRTLRGQGRARSRGQLQGQHRGLQLSSEEVGSRRRLGRCRAGPRLTPALCQRPCGSANIYPRRAESVTFNPLS